MPEEEKDPTEVTPETPAPEAADDGAACPGPHEVVTPDQPAPEPAPEKKEEPTEEPKPAEPDPPQQPSEQ